MVTVRNRLAGSPRAADQLYFVGVEAQVVEAAQALGDPVSLLFRAQRLLPGQLIPEGLVPALEFLARLHRVDPVGQQPS